ncbi:DNA_circ_N domain-containing protein [Vibrio chagasii]|uniref:DNA circularization N-terminal domain-containing protein n=1 Tax=Vibrio chagasii TaxID=170679 RepID=UPI003374AC93|nr:DNA_circ_N domain-containing protein [Vibrio chagasii]CAH7008749.1 DNA_circ_N domain-containing protein [Vibrio chagasii]CAH7124031.1 DNA_circ_N domain-containing protein [Vibrio chagasii]
MWERQYEHARWNGHKLNILSITFDGGKRLQVSEIPYADLPHIKVMGTKARTYTIEAVFVGPRSLAQSNALLDNLDATPEGELEHPWLGELSLVFEDVSQNISTKKGLVTLSLKFVRAGTSPSITAPPAIRTKMQVKAVERLAKERFVEEVKSLDVAQVNQVQAQATSALNVLVGVTNRLNLADEALKEINMAIKDAFSSISSVSTSPLEFAERFTGSIDAVAGGIQSEPSSESEAVDNARSAQQLMLSQVKTNTPTQYHNMQMVAGAIKMNKDIISLEKAETYEITLATKESETIRLDLSILLLSLDDRIREVTQVSTLESMALFDALTTLKSNVKNQQNKVVDGSIAHKTVLLPRYKPALTLAHEEFTKEQIITKMNALQHPLFLKGGIAVREVV